MRNERYWRGKRTDAITWQYQLVLELDVRGSKFDLTKALPFIVCSIPKAPSITPAMVVSRPVCAVPPADGAGRASRESARLASHRGRTPH